MKHLIERDCESIIDNSNLICLFGTSIGDTDKIWWKTIGTWVKKPYTQLIIFSKGEKEIPALKRYKIIREEDYIRSYFLSKTKLNEDEKVRISDKIIIGYDTNIFDFQLDEKETNLSEIQG
ncbi:MAG: hypothetical protein LUF90_10785 [Rikenellaceae bacterium]|nr:hypothetical protein [Rikenellaceae bacterium]